MAKFNNGEPYHGSDGISGGRLEGATRAKGRSHSLKLLGARSVKQ